MNYLSALNYLPGPATEEKLLPKPCLMNGLAGGDSPGADSALSQLPACSCSPCWMRFLKLWVSCRLGMRVLLPNRPVAAQFHLSMVITPSVRRRVSGLGRWKGLLAVLPTQEPWKEMLMQGWSQSRAPGWRPPVGCLLALMSHHCEMIQRSSSPSIHEDVPHPTLG